MKTLRLSNVHYLKATLHLGHESGLYMSLSDRGKCEPTDKLSYLVLNAFAYR